MLSEQPPTDSAQQPVTEDVRARLLEQFSLREFTPQLYTSRWESLYTTKCTPWDRGTPNPALIDTLTNRRDLCSSPLTTSAPQHPGDAVGGQAAGRLVRRKKALVPGCGRGYDVLFLAARGYDAVGLEVSETALELCERTRREEFDGEEVKEVYRAADEEIGRGAVRFVEGDFYDEKWAKEVAEEGFDLIYDYTFFCAMHPDMRPDWAKRMSEILAPNGRLICLEFPLYKNPSEKGPPWGLTVEIYEEHLKRPGVKVPYDDDGNVVVAADVQSGEKALIRVDRWKPERTHEVGAGTDHVSVWMHV